MIKKEYFEKDGKKLIIRRCKSKELRHEGICLYCLTDFISCRNTARFCSNAHRINYQKREVKIRLHEEKINEIMKRYQSNRQ